MFSKEGSTVGKKNKALDVAVRKSDRRRLREVAQKALPPDTSSALLDDIFLQGSLRARKLTHAQLGKIQLFFRDPSTDDEGTLWPFRSTTECVWMSVDGGGPNKHPIECPSVSLLSVVPDFPSVLVPSQVSKYLCRGANLMRAGMMALPDPLVPVVAIRVHGNPQPFAVGHLTFHTTADTIGQDAQGVGVEIWMCYGDTLWKSTSLVEKNAGGNGGPTNPIGGAPYGNGHYGNVGFQDGARVYPVAAKVEEETPEGQVGDTSEVSPAVLTAAGEETSTTESNETKEVDTSSEIASDAQDQQDEEPEDPTKSNDDLLHQSVCQALVNIKDKDLPLASNSFYSQHVLQHRPAGTTIEIKKTSFKKFGTYLLHQQKQGLLTVGEDKRDKNPAGFLKSINRKHQDLRGFKKDKKSAEPGKTRLTLASLYSIPHHFVSLMRLDPEEVKAANAKSDDRRGTGLLTAPEIKAILESYCERESLVSACGTEVVLDGPLTDALYKKSKQGDPPLPTSLSRKELNERWKDRMEPAYAIVELPGSRITKLARGQPPKVQMEVSMRQGRKFITRIRGVEEYGLDGEEFCRDVTKRFACSGGVERDEPTMGNLKKGHVEIVFQGHLAEELRALLTGDERLSAHGGVKRSEYSLPKQCIEVKLKKGVPAKKRK